MGVGGISGGAGIASMVKNVQETDAQQFQDILNQEKIAEDQAVDDKEIEKVIGEAAATAGVIMAGSIMEQMNQGLKDIKENEGV